MKIRLKELVFRGLLAGMLLFVANTSAVATPIDDCLADPGHIKEGDKCFYNFEYTGFESGELLDVVGDTDPDSHHGLFFDLAVIVHSGPHGSTRSRGLAVEYDVVVTDPAFKIHDIELGVMGDTFLGGIFVTEEGFDPSAPLGSIGVVSACIFDIIPCSPLGDVVLSYDVEVLHVRKGILLATSHCSDGTSRCVAALSGMAQHFSQTKVPEPSSVLLTGMGLLGLAGFQKRRANRGR